MTLTEPRPLASVGGGLDADEVFVAGMQRLWVADVGTPFPADVSEDPAPPWYDLGYTTEDGLTGTFGITTDNLMTSQSLSPVRVLVTEKPISFTATLRQLNAESLKVALGGGTVEGDDNSWHYVPPPSSYVDERAFILEGEDGANKLRIGYYRASLSAEVAIPFVNTDSIVLPLTFSILAHEPPFEAWGSSPGFGVGAGPTPATLTAVAPQEGEAGDTVTLTGTNFAPGMTVAFASAQATNVQRTSATQATCTVPAGTGTVAVSVTNPGAAAGTLPNAFTYE